MKTGKAESVSGWPRSPPHRRRTVVAIRAATTDLPFGREKLVERRHVTTTELR